VRPANGANCQTPSLRIVTDLTEAGCVVKKKAAVEERTESRTNCPAEAIGPDQAIGEVRSWTLGPKE
jgi:hypothetical protein